MTRRILIQLDPDPQPSVFDAVVAIDADVEQLLPYGGVTGDQVQNLVHGAMFTRSPADLRHTAIFVGGSQVSAGEALLERIRACFFGPLRVSVLLDANGANTTAAAAVLAAERHVPLKGATALVLAGTGPVGQRVARLLAGQEAHVRVASRQIERAAEVCEQLRDRARGGGTLEPVAQSDVAQLVHEVQLVFAAGAAGVQLLPQAAWQASQSLACMLDLNAVPPLGIEGVEVMDKGQDRQGIVCYGAIGVGGTKMKIHRAAIRRLFESNDQILDAEEVFAIGRALTKS